jgi:hypothetical protein
VALSLGNFIRDLGLLDLCFRGVDALHGASNIDGATNALGDALNFDWLKPATA